MIISSFKIFEKNSFSDKIFYHGTNSEFDRFSQKKYGSGDGSDMLGQGVYITNKLKKAKEYGVNIYIIKIREDLKIINYDNIKHEDDFYDFFDTLQKSDRINSKVLYARKYFDGIDYGSDTTIIFNPKNLKIIGKV